MLLASAVRAGFSVARRRGARASSDALIPPLVD
jgi:hypothetical protein